MPGPRQRVAEGVAEVQQRAAIRPLLLVGDEDPEAADPAVVVRGSLALTTEETWTAGLLGDAVAEACAAVVVACVVVA